MDTNTKTKELSQLEYKILVMLKRYPKYTWPGILKRVRLMLEECATDEIMEMLNGKSRENSKCGIGQIMPIIKMDNIKKSIMMKKYHLKSISKM